MLESLAAIAAAQVGPEHAFDCLGQFVCCHAGEELAADGLMLAKTATYEYMVGIDAFATDFGFGAEAPDITDVMLSAGIRAASEVDVDGLIELEALFQVLDQVESVALGIGLGRFAVAVTGAGHHPAHRVRLPRGDASFFERAFECLNEGIGHIRDYQILPHRKANFSTGVAIGELR